jgi:hypothetical protein
MEDCKVSVKNFTAEDQLAEVERLIEAARLDGRPAPGSAEERTFHILKSIAAEIKGRIPPAAGRALDALQEEVDNVADTKTRAGYDMAALATLGETLMGRWPTARQALELMRDAELQARRTA